VDEETFALREQFRDAIRGAFYSLRDEDGGLQTFMFSAYVQWHLMIDHDDLPEPAQLAILKAVHDTIVKMLHIDPSSLQMAHAHTMVHSLIETYVDNEEEMDEDEEEDEADEMLAGFEADFGEWGKELQQFMEEQKEEPNGSDEEGPPTQDA